LLDYLTEKKSDFELVPCFGELFEVIFKDCSCGGVFLAFFAGKGKTPSTDTPP